ncbi:MAG: hypothetical protein JO291_08815 [Acidimicrobiia bacterium]|nr:hypothetical protein [Acidimicrobiia bacterium]
MDRLLLRMRRWGNDGAVVNARAELIRARERQAAATIVARRVVARDAVRRRRTA